MVEDLLEELKQSMRLPSPPDDVSIADLSDTIAADPALSVRLLKYANSSLLGASSEIGSVRDAVLRLGIRSVRLMSLSFSLVANNDARACQGFDFAQFWTFSLGCGVSSRYLANRNKGVPPEEAFAAGLLANIGKMVLAVGMPEKYTQILER